MSLPLVLMVLPSEMVHVLVTLARHMFRVTDDSDTEQASVECVFLIEIKVPIWQRRLLWTWYYSLRYWPTRRHETQLQCKQRQK